NIFILTNAGNTYLGTTRVDFGSLAITSNGALGDAANALTLQSTSPTTGSLRFDADGIDITRTVNLNLTPSINTNGNTATISGTIAGAGSLTKLGTGTLILAGANTYAGGTTVSAGTLLVNNASGSATGLDNVTIAAAATLAGGNADATKGRIAPDA